MSAPHDDDDDFDDDFLSEVAKVEDLPPPSADTFMPNVGDHLGHFLVVAKLGRGGMGVVFLAEDQRLGRRVALKLLPASVAADPTRRGRLFREARAAAAVSHPYLVTLHETGEQDGRAFLVLEYVSGESMRRVLDQRELAIGEAVGLARKILEGLAHAHCAGLLHRDLKPENILVADDGNPKILDFGLAKLESEPVDPHASGLTREGHILGTPGYMAPEQARGRTVDARADVFSFGATFFEMLTGHRAFEGETPADVVSAVLRDHPKRADDLRSDVPPALADIVEKCLQKEPRERFASCNEILEALDDPGLALPTPIPGDRPSGRRISGPPRPPSTTPGPVTATPSRISTDVPRQPPKRLRYGLAAATVAALAVVAATQYIKPNPTTASTDGGIAAVPTAITDVPPPKSSNPAALALYQQGLQASRDADWGVALENWNKAVELDPKLAAAHLRIAIILQCEKDGPSEARAAFTRVLNSRSELSPRDQALANALEPVIARDPGEFEVTTQRLRELIQKYPNDAELHHWFAMFGAYAHPEGIAAERRAIQLDPQYADAWQILGAQLAYAGHREEALAALAKCVEIAPMSADCRGERARLYSLDGQCTNMEEDLRRALATSSRGLLGWRENRAWALFAIGRSDETVIEVLRPKWQLYSDARRPGIELYDRALIEVARGRFTEAEKLLVQGEKAIENDPNVDPHFRYANLHIGLLTEMDRKKDAARVAQQYLDKKDVWLTRSIASDRTVPFFRVIEHAGLTTSANVIRERDAWLSKARALGTGEPESAFWSVAYASWIDRKDEAQAALDTLPRDSSGEMAAMIDKDVGLAYALAGRGADAIAPLSRAARECDWLRWPIWNTNAVALLADAYAEQGKKKEACDAYNTVISRFAAATKSVTRDRAKAHAALLGCGTASAQMSATMPIVCDDPNEDTAGPSPLPGVDVRLFKKIQPFLPKNLPMPPAAPMPPSGFIPPVIPSSPEEYEEMVDDALHQAHEKSDEARQKEEQMRQKREEAAEKARQAREKEREKKNK